MKRVARTMCPMNCHPTLCGMLVEHEDGRVIGVRGDDDNPDSQGFLCVRGHASREILDNPRRLLHPMIRAERGGEWRRASWDEALDRIVACMTAAGREAVGTWSGHGLFANNYGTRLHSNLLRRFSNLSGWVAGGMFEADAVAVLACAELAQGDADRAHETATVALEMARRRGMRLAECRALFALAASLLTLRGATAHAEVESILDEAAALVRNTGAHSREPLIRLARAELARVIGDDASRQRELREAHRLFLEIGAPIRAEQVVKELAG